MTLVLYHAGFSTCSQAVRMVLAEKALDYDSRPINLAADEHLAADYLAINPNGVVPALVHDGRAITDSTVINEYLDEVFPDPQLAPRDAYARARMREWLRFFEEVTTPAVRIPSFNRVFVKAVRPDRADFAAFTERLPLRKHFYREMGPEGFPPARVAEAIERLRMGFERVERALETEGEWLLGTFSLADVHLMPSVIRMVDLRLDAPIEGLPRLDAWRRRIEARPAFAHAYFPGSRLGVAAVPDATC